jgi:hypothetical protein
MLHLCFDLFFLNHTRDSPWQCGIGSRSRAQHQSLSAYGLTNHGHGCESMARSRSKGQKYVTSYRKEKGVA